MADNTDTAKSVTLQLETGGVDLPHHVGSQGEHALDITKLRATSKHITLDPGYRNTGSCTSDITFIDPEAGVLQYRGYAIEDLAEHSNHIETAYLLIFGDLPSKDSIDAVTTRLNEYMAVDAGLFKLLQGFPRDADAMAMLAACLNALVGYHPEVLETDHTKHFDHSAPKLIAKIITLAAGIHRYRQGEDVAANPPTPDPSLGYAANFLKMAFGGDANAEVAEALDLIFLLHADHEQNCSASTCRMVGSSHASLFASVAAAVGALSGPLHGGANVQIMEQLQSIHDDDSLDAETFFAGVKDKKYRLFGFGHPVYKNYDPRARILKKQAGAVLAAMDQSDDPLLKLAKKLEQMALEDDYFVSRNLYPNVDFYSGILMRAMGVPTDMFTVLFAIGRMPGWVAQWKEVRDQGTKIYRPRQLYTGHADRRYVAADAR